MSGWPTRLAMLGCGNMGRAMLDRWLAAGLPPAAVTVINRSGTAPRADIATATAWPHDDAPDVLVVAIKPQQLAVAEAFVAALPHPPRVVLSILAGVALATLKARLPAAATARAMPNLPVALGQGVTLLNGDPAARAVAETLAAPLGLAEWLDDEAEFDAATALAGSGPGFLFRIIDAMTAAGLARGLTTEQASALAAANLADAARTAPADTLSNDALADLLGRTLAAAGRRNAELAEAARTSA